MEAATFPGTLDALSPIRSYVKTAAESAGLDHSATYNLLLAVDEIATNIVQHGYEEAGLEGSISVEAMQRDNRLVIELADTGKSYDPNSHPEPDDVGLFAELEDRPIGGLGIMLAKDAVDKLEYESTDQGNVHRFVVRLQPRADAGDAGEAGDTGDNGDASSAMVSEDHRKLEILLKISKSLGQEIQLDRLLKLMVSEVTSAMRAERSTLFLVDREDPHELVSRVAEGVGVREIRIPFGFGIAGTAAQTRERINIPDAYQDPRFNPAHDKASGFRTKSLLTNPILDQEGRLTGVVQVLNKKGGGPFTTDDERFLEAICVHLDVAIHRAEMVEAYLQNQIVTKALDLAREIQIGFLPKDFPALPEHKELDIYAAMIPALEVGGDLYDFFLLDEDRLCFVIGDVSDKGIPAALFMAMARTAFKISAIASPESIALTMGRVNQFLCESNQSQMFVTALAGTLDLKTGRVEYADAGHEPPFIRTPSGSVIKIEKVGGIALGFVPNHKFRSGTLQLNPGDALVLYTDGVTEAMNVGRELFGAEAIEVSLAKEQGQDSERILRGVLADVRGFVGGAHQSDDITMLVIRYIGRGAGATISVS